MCVILDTSARDDVFGTTQTTAGRQFFKWLETRRARLVIGGKLTEELTASRVFEKWAEIALSDGRITNFGKSEVEKETHNLSQNWAGRSNDPHVIALSRVSKARILYANDQLLCEDFKDTALIPKPRGKIYPTGESQNATKQRRRLLQRAKPCPNQ